VGLKSRHDGGEKSGKIATINKSKKMLF